MNRRKFTKAVALTPLGFMLSPQLHGQQEPGKEAKRADPFPSENKGTAVPTQHTAKSAPQYGKRPPIHETEPFADPVVFKRSSFRPRVRSFALGQIHLDAGPFQQARDWNRGYMLRLGNDRLLHNFRLTAGIATSAQPLGGWEAPSSELRGHFVGHYLSACAFMIGSTGDAVIKTKADELVADIAVCQKKLNEGGYVSAFPSELFVRLDKREKVWAPFYTLHKIMAGLYDMSTNGSNSQAMDVLLGLADWIDVWTAARTPEHMQEILKTEYGGMNEVLHDIAGLTGDDRWARTGDRFNKKTFFTPLAMRRDELFDLHANTHLPQVLGAARRYELSSDYRFRDVSEFFWETVTESRTYVTGGSSNAEAWLTHPNHLGLELAASTHHQECCCAYNMMKLTRRLYEWNGDVRLIDFYERNLLNHRLGAIEPETGRTTYFLSMSPGAWKTICTEDQTFWCCTGSALEDYAKLNNTIYHHDDNSVYVNLFIASRLDWTEKGIRIQQQTRFPEEAHTALTIEAAPATPWTMRLRLPAWTTDAAALKLNGKSVEVLGSPGGYLKINRVWQKGDRVELSLPMHITAEGVRDDPTVQAFLYGPVVLAGQFPKDGLSSDLLHKNQGPEIWAAPDLQIPAMNSGGKPVAEWIVPVPGKPLTFETVGQEQNVTLRPLNESWDRFAVYWTVT